MRSFLLILRRPAWLLAAALLLPLPLTAQATQGRVVRPAAPRTLQAPAGRIQRRELRADRRDLRLDRHHLRLDYRGVRRCRLDGRPVLVTRAHRHLRLDRRDLRQDRRDLRQDRRRWRSPVI